MTADLTIDSADCIVLPSAVRRALDLGAGSRLRLDKRGVRGGAVYDWLHLAAARKAGAEVFFTLNLRDFRALARPGDPAIQSPAGP